MSFLVFSLVYSGELNPKQRKHLKVIIRYLIAWLNSLCTCPSPKKSIFLYRFERPSILILLFLHLGLGTKIWITTSCTTACILPQTSPQNYHSDHTFSHSFSANSLCKSISEKKKRKIFDVSAPRRTLGTSIFFHSFFLTRGKDFARKLGLLVV